MRSSRMLCSLLSVFLCFLTVLSPAAAVGNYWTIDELEADPFQELEDIKGAGPAADQPEVMSFYEFDNVVSVDQPMMFSMNSAEELVSVTDDVTSFVGLDFFERFSTDFLGSFVISVYHPKTTIGSVTIPEFTEQRWFPENGSEFSKVVHSDRVQFQTGRISIPDVINGGEVQSIDGLVFQGFDSGDLDYRLSFGLDISDLGELHSFELLNSFRCWGVVWDSNLGMSIRAYFPTSLELLVDGALVKTFYPESDQMTFNFDDFNFSRSDVIDSIVFRFAFPKTENSLSYTDHSLVPAVSLYFDDATFSVDMPEKAFREKVTTGIGNIFQGILELPGKIVNLLVDGLKSLFIPSEDDMTSLTGRYQQLLSERLGFIWQAYELVSNLFTGILDALESGGAYEFSFPGISFPFNGEELVLLPETPVSLENEVMDVIRPVLGTIVCFISVVGFINVAEGMVMALISGVSYYEFLHGRKGGSG